MVRAIMRRPCRARVKVRCAFANAGRRVAEAPTYLESWVGGAVDVGSAFRGRRGVRVTLGDIAAPLIPVGLRPSRFVPGMFLLLRSKHGEHFSAGGAKRNRGAEALS